MTDPLARLVQPLGLEATLFPPESRYHGLSTATLERPDGTVVVYLRRRFVPPPEQFADLLLHTVVEGDRLDLLAARYLGDPEAFWRLADANRALQPEELLVEVGRRLRVTLPAGIPGAPRER
jgi:hypothetical protein